MKHTSFRSQRSGERNPLADQFDIDEKDLQDTHHRMVIEDQERQDTAGRKWNLATVIGLVMVAAAGLGITSQVFGLGFNLTAVLRFFAIFGGVLVVFYGLGLFTRSKKRTMRQARLYEPEPEVEPYALQQRKKLFRSREDRMLFGVCGGLAEYFNVDPTIVRVLFVLLMLSYGTSLLIYLIMAIAIPRRPLVNEMRNR